MRYLICGDGNKRQFSSPKTIDDALKIFPFRYKSVNGPLETPCWEWLGAREVAGYGYMLVAGKHIKAHRLSFVFHNIPIAGNEKACHRCDNPPCVNPDHLFTGTNGDNIRDAIKKGRWTWPKGEQVGTHKLTAQDVTEIRRLRSLGVHHKQITSQFGIGTTMFYYIVNHTFWKHVA